MTMRIRGFSYFPEFFNQDEEATFLDRIQAFPPTVWEIIQFMGQVARRQMVCFRYSYVTASRLLTPAPPMRSDFSALRDRCAKGAGVRPHSLEQLIVNHYPHGAGIGAHSDAPVFGEPIVALSLAARCRMKFTRPGQDHVILNVKRRSMYVLRDEARWNWRHSVLPLKSQRFSLTFRLLSESFKASQNAAVLGTGDRP